MSMTLEGKITPRSQVRFRPTGAATQTRPVASRRTRKANNQTAIAMEPARASSAPRAHWLLLVGLAMTGTLLLLWIGQVALAWGTQTLDDWKYGRPRTTQVDAFVQHEVGKTPSHFIAVNLDGHIKVVELPGGNMNAARMYPGPSLSGEGAALIPVQLWFEDRNGDHVPDMVIQAGQAQQWYRNDPGQGRFVSP